MTKKEKNSEFWKIIKKGIAGLIVLILTLIVMFIWSKIIT